jgi:hypothetical protein
MNTRGFAMPAEADVVRFHLIEGSWAQGNVCRDVLSLTGCVTCRINTFWVTRTGKKSLWFFSPLTSILLVLPVLILALLTTSNLTQDKLQNEEPALKFEALSPS